MFDFDGVVEGFACEVWRVVSEERREREEDAGEGKEGVGDECVFENAEERRAGVGEVGVEEEEDKEVDGCITDVLEALVGVGGRRRGGGVGEGLGEEEGVVEVVIEGREERGVNTGV